MKKLILYIIFIFCFFNSFGQPIVFRSSAVLTVQDARWKALLNLFVPVYNDTTTANLPSNIGIDSTGAIIFTRDVQQFWGRAASPKRWVSLGSGGSGGGALNNLGVGYRFGVQGTSNIKTLFAGFGTLVDSTSNANALTIKVDSTKFYLYSNPLHFLTDTSLVASVLYPLYPANDTTLAIDTGAGRSIIRTWVVTAHYLDSVLVGAGTITSANNGVKLTGTVVQWGDGVGGTASALTSKREISFGAFGDPYTMKFYQTSAGAFPEFSTTFRLGYAISLQGADGGSISFDILDSTATLGNTNAGFSFYKGYNFGTLLGSSGIHWSVADKHYDIIDLRDVLTYAAIQGNGTSRFIVAADGTTMLAASGTKRAVVGTSLATNNILANFEVVGSTYLTDSLSINNILTGGSSDSLLVISSSKVVKKVAQSSMVNIYNSDGTMTGNRVVTGNGLFTITGATRNRFESVTTSNKYTRIDETAGSMEIGAYNNATSDRALITLQSFSAPPISTIGGPNSPRVDISASNIGSYLSLWQNGIVMDVDTIYLLNRPTLETDTSLIHPLGIVSDGFGHYFVKSMNYWPGGGGGGTPFLPVTGTGTATGNIIGDLDGNTLQIRQNGVNFLSIDPTVDAESVFLGAYNNTDDGSTASFSGQTNGALSQFAIVADFNDNTKRIRILANADATTSTLKLESDSIYLVSTLSGKTSGMVWTLQNQLTGSGYWASASGAVSWNGITNPTADQALTFDAGESSTWTNSNTTEDLFTVNSSTITTSSFLSLNSTSTALAAGNNLAELIMSGANGTNAITATALNISVTNTNVTSGTNTGINITASGATTNNIGLSVLANTNTFTPSADNQNTLQVNTAGGNKAVQFGTLNGFSTYGGMWGGNTTPSASNYAFASNGTQTLFNSATDMYFRIANGATSYVNILSPGVGIFQSAPNSRLHTTSLATAYVAKTGNYTATIDDYTITGDASGGNFQITLPTAVGITGRIYVIKSISTGTVTVGTTSSQTIDGSTTKVLNTQYAGVIVQSTGSAWIIIGTF